MRGILGPNGGKGMSRPITATMPDSTAPGWQATRAGVEGTQRTRILTPLISLKKSEIIRSGLALGVDYAETISCYDPAADGTACGRCDACVLRARGFAEVAT